MDRAKTSSEATNKFIIASSISVLLTNHRQPFHKKKRKKGATQFIYTLMFFTEIGYNDWGFLQPQDAATVAKARTLFPFSSSGPSQLTHYGFCSLNLQKSSLLFTSQHPQSGTPYLEAVTQQLPNIQQQFLFKQNFGLSSIFWESMKFHLPFHRRSLLQFLFHSCNFLFFFAFPLALGPAWGILCNFSFPI